SSSTSPVTSAFDGSRPITAAELTLLPEPDSPTIASVSPGATAKSMPSTAGTGPPSVATVTCRSWTSSTGSAVEHRRVEHTVHYVHHQVREDDQEGREQRDADDHGHVELTDRADQQVAEALHAEDLLGQDGTTEQPAEIEAEQRHDRHEHTPQS